MSHSAERWRIIQAVFAEASELTGGERQERLAQITFGDPSLRAEVEALLIASEKLGDRFERSPAETMLSDARKPVVGTRIGPYVVLREIGRGGMGTVYEALRDDAFKKRVALKMVPAGRDTESILRRFRYERQILARLEHRNIAALLDGGVSESGQPYFAMEYVEGLRIDEYCRVRRLGVRDRLQLFRQVCAAVQYAHQNLVVHRDLKPSNILVADDGTVKLLDFGIAKLLDPGDSEGGDLTQTGVAPMTTGYASPEQLSGKQVTTASDIYSLGVVLYELLAGRPPFDLAQLPVLEARRRMLESTPTPPSRAVNPDTLSSGTEPTARRLQRALAGELDNIVMMALRKEPDRRYPSVEALGEDVLRFLAGLPIQATPDSVGYRFGKLVRRNRLAVAATALAAFASIAGTVTSLWQARIARSERDRAREEQAKSEEVTGFFKSIFDAAAPHRQGLAVTVVEAMDAAIPRIDSAFASRPAIRTALKSAIGSTFFDMGLAARAEPLLHEALALQTQLDSGRTTYAGANAVYNVAGVANALGRLPAAESLFRRSMAMYEAVGESRVGLAQGYGQLAMVLSNQGRLDEGLAIQKRALDLLRAELPRTDRSVMVAVANYAANLTEAGRLTDAEPFHREAVALAEAARGPEDAAVAAALQPLAINLALQGKLPAAESVARRGWSVARSALGPTNPATVRLWRTVVGVLVDQDRCAEAMPMAREIIALRRELTDGDPSIASAYIQLGECQGRGTDLGPAADALQTGLALRRETLPAGHWAIALTESLLGDALVRSGRQKEGEALLASGYEGLRRTQGPDQLRTRQARERLAGYYRANGRAAAADSLK
ncbi:MAG: protein kinase domain-containing protein [Gemmatimonadales bacterium]